MKNIVLHTNTGKAIKLSYEGTRREIKDRFLNKFLDNGQDKIIFVEFIRYE